MNFSRLSVAFLICLFPQILFAYSLDDILKMSPRSVQRSSFKPAGGFIGKKFFYLGAPPNTMDSKGDEFLFFQVIDPATDKVIETLNLSQTHGDEPFGVDPAHKNLIESFQRKYGFTVEQLSLDLKKFPVSISGLKISPKIITDDSKVKKAHDSLTYAVLLERSDGTKKEITRFKEFAPCSNGVEANLAISEQKPRPLTIDELKASCRPPTIFGYFISPDNSRMVLLISDFPTGGYFEGSIEWSEVTHLVGAEMKTGFKTQ